MLGCYRDNEKENGDYYIAYITGSETSSCPSLCVRYACSGGCVVKERSLGFLGVSKVPLTSFKFGGLQGLGV